MTEVIKGMDEWTLNALSVDRIRYDNFGIEIDNEEAICSDFVVNVGSWWGQFQFFALAVDDIKAKYIGKMPE